MTEREYFENYMRKQNPCVRLNRQSYVRGGAYLTITVERAWRLWHAAWMTSSYEAERKEDAALVALPVIDPSMMEVGK